MADFYQSRLITPLHRLGQPSLERLEAELELYSMVSPIALVLPALYSDVQSEAMKGIVEELKKAKFIKEIVLSLGPATDDEFKRVKEFLSVLPQEVSVIHNSGKRIEEIYRIFDKEGVSAGKDGKGRSAWLSYGYVLARGKCEVIALHDCDIKSYSREMLARLCYPVVNPSLDFVFCKGYYARVTNKLHGRVTRLFVTPLVRALERIIGNHPFLEFIDNFRYPLAGEVCMVTELARVNRIPWDWGLEVGVLAEVYRNYSPRRVCQVDIAENYEHKHQPLSEEDPSTGLTKMSIDIAKSLFRTLASEGIVFSDGFFKTLVVTYQRLAEDTLARYEGDAAINGLEFDRHSEARAVDAFTRGITIAAETIRNDPLGAPLIPNWNRVISAIPGILERLKEAVEEDNKL
ncbi:MAG TPA: glycosyl transferase [Deltaproteobacteria bacterium]|nr:glycosyl transferase [Deltaproteobacteria bacterium]